MKKLAILVLLSVGIGEFLSASPRTNRSKHAQQGSGVSIFENGKWNRVPVACWESAGRWHRGTEPLAPMQQATMYADAGICAAHLAAR